MRHSLQVFGSVCGADIPDGDCIHIQCLKEYLHWPSSSVYLALMEESDDFEAGKYVDSVWCLHAYLQVSAMNARHQPIACM